MAQPPAELLAHREWLGQIQKAGLVVSPIVLLKQGVFADRQKGVDKQVHLRELLETPLDFATFSREILEWPDGLLAGAHGGPELPDSLTVALPNYEDSLSPTYAVPAPDAGTSDAAWLALVSVVSTDTDLDHPPADHVGWRASPTARIERLLRDTGVPIGLLFNGALLRLVYAPKGESSGHLTFRFAHLIETLGRPMVSALYALLGVERLTDVSVEEQRLPALLRESRRYQNEVSTALAGQVLEALWELLRGFQRAHDDSKGQLLRTVLAEDPHEVYGGLLATLMRLVFILYAEDRGLMPQGEVYQRHYSVSGLFERLREEDARYPDTMDARYGAWAQLLSLFRLIYDGGGHGDMRFTARLGRLFNPDVYPFLEGRSPRSARQIGEPLEAPKLPDGTVFRVLRNLLVLDGERLSYRALDVEQIGSVYEAMMGFALEVAKAPSVAVAPKHVVIDLEVLLDQQGKDRAGWLKDRAELKITSETLAKAASIPELLSALGTRLSRYTPNALGVGAMYLQPTEERRRSGSHYTPRSLTEPIVRTTLLPILERLGDQATPEQILDLKVCDPAMGSGAFLVEACRLLGDRLVKAWEDHNATPSVPDDEDAITLARRIVAERCLYGVDKNIFAVDLAKLSIWLATLAREHPFTFLDHALRHGDSLVGLSREQIACLHWSPRRQLPLIRAFIEPRVAKAQRLRQQIQGLGSSDDIPEKARLLRDAEEAIDDVRLIGDVVISVFFERDKPRDREILRTTYAGKVESWLDTIPSRSVQGVSAASLKEHDVETDLRGIRLSLVGGDQPIPAFHWELEFPEVFTRDHAGFDAFVGNPPFAGKNTISAANRESYLPWLLETRDGSHGNADLVAHFFRRAFSMLRPNGMLGLIATNTIAQGDTRATGLCWIRNHGGTIYAARKRVKWPGGAAAVIVSVVHIARGFIAVPCNLDGRPVDRITAFLFHTGSDSDPIALSANANKSFIGSYVLGMGFTFDDTDKNGVASPISWMHELVQKDPRNAERIFPYIGGEEVNDNPTHALHRHVINFGQMPLRRERSEPTWAEGDEHARERWLRTGVVPLDYPNAVAADWPALLSVLERKVKGTRASHSTAGWWQFERLRGELYEAIQGLKRVLVIPRVSQYWAPTFLPPGYVYADSLVVVATASAGVFSLLQSRVHEFWSRFFGSSLEERPRYTPSDCFETFPFPAASDSEFLLEQAGREYIEFRAALMARNNEGPTKTYSRFHDPEERDPGILRLRDLHDEVDRAVLDAYGWTNIRPACGFYLEYEDEQDERPGKASKRRKPWRYRWPDDVRDDVLARLLELNVQRAQEERLAGKVAKTGAKGEQRRQRRSRKTADTPLLTSEPIEREGE